MCLITFEGMTKNWGESCSLVTAMMVRATADGHFRFFLWTSRTGVVDSVPAEAMNSTVEASQLRLEELLYVSLPAAVVRAGV